MPASPSPRLPAVLLVFAWCATGAVIALGIAGLAGWAFSLHTPITVPPPAGTLNPFTAAGLMLCGLSLALLVGQPSRSGIRRRTSAILACAALLMGMLKLATYRLPLGVHRALLSEQMIDRGIAPNTAGCLAAVGIALLLIDYRLRRGYRPALPLALLTATVALLALTGYLYASIWFHQVPRHFPMPLSAAVAFLLLGLGIVAARPNYQPMATLLSDTAGGVVARRLLPAAAFLPLLVGILCLLGGKLRFYERPFSITLYSLLTTIIFVALVWWNARSLRRLDIGRRRAEQRAAEEHHLLRSLIDNLPDMVFVKDLESHFLLSNVAHAHILCGAGPEQMIGKTDFDFFKPELAAEYRADEARIIQTGVPLLDKEQQFVDEHGIMRWVNVTKVAFHDRHGNVVGTVGIAHDMTKRKQAEEERDRFFTLSADMMCIAGFDGFFKRVNSSFETVLGYTMEEITSRPWLELVHPDDRAATVNEGKKLSLGAVTLAFENRYMCKDGSFRWLSWTVVPVVHEQRLYAVARDTTERRRVEERLREANRSLEEAIESERAAQQTLRTAQSSMVQTEKLAGLGQMVAGVAHEINNPLSFVSNNIAVLQRDLRGVVSLLKLYGQAEAPLAQCSPDLLTEIQQLTADMDLPYVLNNLPELFSRTREGLRRIQQIVKDLRDFARLDESDLHEVNLNEGIESTITIIAGHAKKRGVELKPELAALPKVTCYPAKINQVVMNLLTNAIDACSENGKVTIRTRADDSERVKIEVIDTGTGIAPAVRERIFDPFFTTKPLGQGTGLGLSISYGIVRDHGGTIEVQSELGRGSTFTVTLPVAGPKRTAAASAKRSELPHSRPQ